MVKRTVPVNLGEEIIKMIQETKSERTLKLVYDCVVNLRKSDVTTTKAPVTENETSAYGTINRRKLCDCWDHLSMLGDTLTVIRSAIISDVVTDKDTIDNTLYNVELTIGDICGKIENLLEEQEDFYVRYT